MPILTAGFDGAAFRNAWSQVGGWIAWILQSMTLSRSVK
jgi:hypothetical protein